MTPVEYYPPSLTVIIDMNRTNQLNNKDAGLFCHECEGNPTNPNFGNMLILDCLANVVEAAQDHDESHHVTIVDKSNCGMGMW